MPGKNDSPAWLLGTFDELVPDGASKKNMFGHPAMWVNGNMFVMLVDAELGVRLGDEHKEQLLKQKGAGAFEPRGKCNFHGMARIPEGKLRNKVFLRKWIELSFGHALSLPPKVKKTRKVAAKRKTK